MGIADLHQGRDVRGGRAFLKRGQEHLRRACLLVLETPFQNGLGEGRLLVSGFKIADTFPGLVLEFGHRFAHLSHEIKALKLVWAHLLGEVQE